MVELLTGRQTNLHLHFRFQSSLGNITDQAPVLELRFHVYFFSSVLSSALCLGENEIDKITGHIYIGLCYSSNNNISKCNNVISMFSFTIALRMKFRNKKQAVKMFSRKSEYT